ncbi:hypothetical protein DB30_04950 [Enhygromyxa salina]|uniref:Glycosyltransferase RgtA/B/C/D-like domain-containing protein n=1 Tax=Enhygromyxa salina TaxID=215803 RepID=A0A0C1ZXV5_9BACT|nr:hypothetical protein [Enhygromyxa salina]KIG16078.1 hypothetical protein DB30_04950 [Enhygromyxa salina]
MPSAHPLAREPFARDERVRWLIALFVLAIAAVAVRWPAVQIGPLSDDYMQDAMIAGLYPGAHYVPFDLYAFARSGASVTPHVEQGTLPWFVEANFHGAVLRPLSSLLLWLDHVIAPRSVRLWHVHSLLWFAASIFAFGLCARRMLPRWPAALAVVLYACEAAFDSPLGWLANRCVLICAVFGFAAIWAHIEWRQPDPDTPTWLRRHGPVVELVLMTLCLAAGEYGLGVVVYVFAWELFAGPRDGVSERPSGPTKLQRLRSSARALVPATIPVLGYLACHQLLGYGTIGADVYADPINSPRAWFEWAQLRLPKLATGALWAVPASTIEVFRHPAAQWWNELWPSDTPAQFHQAHATFGRIGVALAAAALALARFGLHDDERRTLRAALLGAALGLLPVSVAPAHSRLLVVAQLGACVAISLIVFGCGRLLLGRGRPESSLPSANQSTKASASGREALARAEKSLLVQRVLGVALVPFAAAMLWLHTVEDLKWTRRYLIHLDGMQASNVAAFTEGDLLDQELAGRDVIVMNGPSQSVAMYGPFVLHVNGMPVPNSWRSLALGGDHPIWVFRPSDKVLELAAIRGAWLQTAGELFFRRSDRLLPTGSTFDYPSVKIEVLADDGGNPTRLRFSFSRSLDDPSFLFLISTRNGLMQWDIPPIEGSKTVPRPRLPYLGSRVGNRDVLFTADDVGGRGPK